MNLSLNDFERSLKVACGALAMKWSST